MCVPFEWTVRSTAASSSITSSVSYSHSRYGHLCFGTESAHLKPTVVGVNEYQVPQSTPVAYVCTCEGPREVWNWVNDKWFFLLVGSSTVARLS